MKYGDGGKGMLTGFVENIPLSSGSVHTTGSMYIGQHGLPYDLILGRTWMKSNRVSILEKPEGTFLGFGTPGTKSYSELDVEKAAKIEGRHLKQASSKESAGILSEGEQALLDDL